MLVGPGTSYQQPAIVVRSILNQYMSQRICTEWNSQTSHAFTATNGTRQGAVASPILFCIYLDILLHRLKDNGVGCHKGHKYAASFAYADDIILLSPTLAGLQQMLKTCEEYGDEYKLSFNEKKTVCIRFSKKKNPDYSTDVIKLRNKLLKWMSKVTHLGNILTYDLKDDNDIKVKKGAFHGHVNKLLVQFPDVSLDTKRRLFKSYCTSYYGNQTWDMSNKQIQSIATAWNIGVRRLLRLPYTTHRAFLPDVIKCDSFMCILYKRIAKFIYNGLTNRNGLVTYLFNSACLERSGTIGRNFNVLNSVLHVSIYDFTTSPFRALINRIGDFFKVPDHNQAFISLINELIDGDFYIDGFEEERNELIDLVCTI